LLPTSLLKSIEKIINRGIEQSSTAAGLCISLEKKSLLMNFSGVALRLRFLAEARHVRIDQEKDQPADAEIIGSPLALMRVATADDLTPMREGVVEIRGDTDVAEQFSQLLRLAAPDPEEELSRFVGDAAAHQAGIGAKAVRNWADKAAQTFTRSISEFLQEESHALPTRAEVDDFMTEVDILSNDFARLESKFDLLKSNSSKGRNS